MESSINRRRLIRAGLLSLAAATVAPALPNAWAAAKTRPLARLEPASGAYFGVNLDWAHDSIAAIGQRLGVQPATYVNFFSFPFTQADLTNLDGFMEQVRAVHGLAVVTLQPTVPLASVTDELATDLANRLRAYNDQGTPILVRFAHEMNGSWYAWSQQPSEYVAAFRRVAQAIHAKTTETGMLWAPNNGAGYPFTGGQYAAKPGTADYAALDTNQDGTVTEADDAYAPYYPGDDAVDWVGMSLYHWGNAYPWGENEIPESGKFVALLTGSYNGDDGDHRDVRDFYKEYVSTRGKPMAIVETAAFFNTAATSGAYELPLKQAWWRQVFSSTVAKHYPGIKMINWFEWRKSESEVGGSVVDWTVTTSGPVESAFRKDLPVQRLILAPLSGDHPSLTPATPTAAS